MRPATGPALNLIQYQFLKIELMNTGKPDTTPWLVSSMFLHPDDIKLEHSEGVIRLRFPKLNIWQRVPYYAFVGLMMSVLGIPAVFIGTASAISAYLLICLPWLFLMLQENKYEVFPDKVVRHHRHIHLIQFRQIFEIDAGTSFSMKTMKWEGENSTQVFVKQRGRNVCFFTTRGSISDEFLNELNEAYKQLTG
jgi:hypothetical protein